MSKKINILLLLLFFFCGAQAQQQGLDGFATIRGRVEFADPHNSLTMTPISAALIYITPAEQYAITGDNGNYEFSKIQAGTIAIKVSHIGMEDYEMVAKIEAGKEYEFNIKMTPSTFRINEVKVTAQNNKFGKGTSSKISRQAIDHLQATSLSDLFQLLPGVEISNPNMSSANTLSIRTLGGTSDSYNMNSMGTSIVIDGAPLSNNSNLQTLAPAANGGAGVLGGGSSPNSGSDVRPISLGNIKSVEVVRGVASVEYGDMTSGVVLVESEAGKSPFTVQFKANPYIYQVSASKGLELGNNNGALFLSGDYSYNTTQQTEAYNYYQRVSLRGLYTKRFGQNLYTNTSLDLSYGMDKRDKNPNDIRSQRATGAEDMGFRFNTKGTISTPNAGWLKSLKYNASINYTSKNAYNEELLGNAFSPYSMSMTDGAVISNRPGQSVYDENGKEITNIPDSEKDFYSTYLPNEYFSRYEINGKELNGFFKVNATFNKEVGQITNRILVGMDYKFDGNKGEGITYDKSTPPYRTFTGNAFRPRAFNDIPFIHQLGVYVEENFTWNYCGDRDFSLSAGVRFNQVNDKNIVTPRINAAINLVKNDRLELTLRGGYGINAKAPTSIYLYPDKAYFDYTNFNSLGDTDVTPENEQLFISTTRVFDTENKDLKIASNRKSELGLDFSVDQYRLAVTGYDEKLKNGYSFGNDLSTFNLVPYTIYEIASKVPGGIPTLKVQNTYNVFAIYDKPLNNVKTRNKGVEYELNLGRFDAIRTSLYINGAWMRTSSSYSGNSYSIQDNKDNYERHIGIYGEDKVEYNSQKFNTTFRLTHNIPKIGFVVTLTAQANWKSKVWNEYNNDDMLESYISYKDGNVYDFTPAMKEDPEFSYMLPTLSDKRFIAETYKPTVLFNMMLSKEVGDFLTASFFVNNIFNNRPLYESKKNAGSYTELLDPTFFGFDVKIKF